MFFFASFKAGVCDVSLLRGFVQVPEIDEFRGSSGVLLVWLSRPGVPVSLVGTKEWPLMSKTHEHEGAIDIKVIFIVVIDHFDPFIYTKRAKTLGQLCLCSRLAGTPGKLRP